jgi:hypothetical protein
MPDEIRQIYTHLLVHRTSGSIIIWLAKSELAYLDMNMGSVCDAMTWHKILKIFEMGMYK